MESTLWAVLCLVIFTAVIAQEWKVVCYVNRATSRNEFPIPSFLENTSCTHIIYSHAKISNSSVYLEDSDRDAIEKLKNLYNDEFAIFPSILLQIGDAEDRELYSEITSSPNNRREFIQSIIELVNETQIYGVDLHWKFPGRKEPPEKRNYVSLAQELREEITKLPPRVRPYLISMVVPPNKDQIVPGFNLLFLNSVVDFFNLPAYNFTMENRSPDSYHHAPLSSPESNMTETSLTSLVKLYLRIGLVARSLVIGVPLFGRLSNGDEIIDPEIPINQVCQIVAEDGWSKAGNSVNGPLFINDDLVLSVETINSVEEKAKLVATLGLGGIMFWNYFMDDWNKTCPQNGSYDFQNGFRYPFIATASQIVNPPLNATFVPPQATLRPALVSEGGGGGGYAANSLAFEEQSTPFIDYEENTNSPIESNEDEHMGSGISNGTNTYVPYSSYGGYVAPVSISSSNSYPNNSNQGASAFGYSSHVYSSGQGYNQQGRQSTTRPNVPNTYAYPLTKIVEAGKDIVIEETYIQINENNYYSRQTGNKLY